MKNSKIVLTAFLCLFVFVGFAQTDFRQGYYINLDDEIVHGLIDYRGDIRNSKVCVFKKDLGSEAISFEPKDIKAYRFEGGKYYISKLINLENAESKQVFLEYLVNGIASLYYFFDSEPHYLIELNGKLVELSNEEKEVKVAGKGDYIRESKKYIGTLKAIMSSSHEIQPQIDKAELSHESLINVVKNYHDYVCNGEKCIIYEKELPPVRFLFAPVIGLNLSKLKFGEDELYSTFDNRDSYSLSIGCLMNVSPILSEKLSVDLGLNFMKNYYFSYGQVISTSGTKTSYYDLHIRTSILQPYLALKYTFPRGKIRPTLAIGTTVNFLLAQKAKLVKEDDSNGIVSTYEYDVDPISKNHLGAFLQIGCNYKLTDKYMAFTNLKYHRSYKSSDAKTEEIQTVNLNFGVYF